MLGDGEVRFDEYFILYPKKGIFEPPILSVGKKNSALPKETYFRENTLGIPGTSETIKRGKTELYSDHKAPHCLGEKTANAFDNEN